MHRPEKHGNKPLVIFQAYATTQTLHMHAVHTVVEDTFAKNSNLGSVCAATRSKAEQQKSWKSTRLSTSSTMDAKQAGNADYDEEWGGGLGAMGYGAGMQSCGACTCPVSRPAPKTYVL